MSTTRTAILVQAPRLEADYAHALRASAGVSNLTAAEIARRAKEYGKAAAERWADRVEAKLAGARVTAIGQSDGEISFLARRAVADGMHDIELRTQRVLKRTPSGRIYHQFPSRLYVDGKLVTEAAYRQLFA